MRQCSPYIFCALHKNICTLTPGLQGRQVISPCMCHLVHPLTHPSDTFCSNAFIPRHPRPRHVVRIRSEIPPPISKGRPWQRTRAAGQLQDRAISAVLGWAKTEGGWLGMFMRRWLRWENENHTPGSGLAGVEWGAGNLTVKLDPDAGTYTFSRPHPTNFIYAFCIIFLKDPESILHLSHGILYGKNCRRKLSLMHMERNYIHPRLLDLISVGFQDGEIQLKRQWHF